MVGHQTLLMLCMISAGSFVDLQVTTDGPRTIYEGIVVLEATRAEPDPCIDFTIDLPKGPMVGPVISSDPGQPMLPFAHFVDDANRLQVWWCSFRSPLMDQHHYSIPRNFVFHVTRTQFGPEDLEKLLGEWGSEGSAWDLDLDGTVGGGDLVELLAGWSPDDGEA